MVNHCYNHFDYSIRVCYNIMDKKDIFKGSNYHLGSPDGPIVTVYSIHEYIDNHYYIRYVEGTKKGTVNTSQRERLYPLQENV